MQDKVGDSFWGTVAGVTGFGLFMELDDIYIEGLLHVTELGNDYFTYDKARHAMVGEKTNLTYRLGDRLEIKVIRVDLDSIKIDLGLIGSQKKPSKKFKKSFIRAEKSKKKIKRRKKK
jgi:ribonuclease R